MNGIQNFAPTIPRREMQIFFLQLSDSSASDVFFEKYLICLHDYD